MAPSVTIRSGVSGSDDPTTVDPSQWEDLLDLRRRHCRIGIPADCRLLVTWSQDAAGAKWLGFGTRERYLREGLGLDPATVEWALQGLALIDPTKPVPYDQAVEVGKIRAKPGRPSFKELRDSYGDSIVTNSISQVPERGNSRDYTIARLERDAPELANQVKSGKKSANAAAKEAGFRKAPKKKTAIDILRSGWRKATDDERSAFLEEIHATYKR